MRILFWFCVQAATAALLSPLCEAAQPVAVQQMRGPLVGLFFDAEAGAVRPIRGIPGASTLGKPLELGTAVSRAAISPQQDSALAVTAGDSAVIHIRIAALDSVSVNPIEGAAPGADLIALSPEGKAAAVYRRDSNTVQIVTGLPDAPTVAGTIDLSGQPGSLTALAVRDDGALLGGFSDQESGLVVLMRPEGSAQLVAALGHVAAVSWLAGSGGALVADDRENKVHLIRDVEGGAAAAPIASESEGISRPVAVEASADGRRALVAGAGGMITAVDLADGISLVCPCRPAGLVRVNTESVFALTDRASDPIWLLDAGSEPRLVFVPADPRPEPGAEVQR